jgi:hypothetical protein
MKAEIEVKDAEEAEAIQDALADPVIHAVVLIVGVLKKLPSDASRRRVLREASQKAGCDMSKL